MCDWRVVMRQESPLRRRVPRDIQAAFDWNIRQAVIREEWPDYRKWLRLYLDFCSKYGHLPRFCRSSLRKTNRRSDRRKRPGPYYYERLYPMIFTVAGACQGQGSPSQDNSKVATLVRALEFCQPFLDGLDVFGQLENRPINLILGFFVAERGDAGLIFINSREMPLHALRIWATAAFRSMDA
jgi:hypothetical protein